ncbi:MAG: HIT family protein [Treponema sp.]|nr:HIT family protein [Treponema sp.]
MGCFYCDKDDQLYGLMTEICQLSVSTLYLFREQTYRGRCNVVYNKHAGNLYDLSDSELGAFMLDVKKAAKAIAKAFSPDKINYGAYADKMQHLHMHVVPKYTDGANWGGTFEMNPQKVYLTDNEYAEMMSKIKNNL